MRNQIIVMGLFLVAMFTGCSHDESTEPVDRKQTSVSAEFVSADEAKTIAAAVQFGAAEATTANGKATTRSAGLNKEVESITPVPDASGATAFYVINYRGGGFMLLAADKRVNPVLAFSEEGRFSMNNPSGFPDGLADWMDDTKAHVQEIRIKNELQTEAMEAAWMPEFIQMMVAGGPTPPPSKGVDPDEGENCESESKTYGPLLKTTWHQRPGYNDLAPYGSCSQTTNGRALAGCVAIAVAQVMRYHRFPGAYNWNAMPVNYATMETAKLIRDVGDAVDMDYHCSHSSSDLKKAAKALRNTFHYGSAKYMGKIKTSIIEHEIINGRPVILGGHRYSNIFSYPGHAWVCDGYKYSLTYYYKCEGALYKWFHMNWGWREDSYNTYNGWYIKGDYSPTKGINYNHYQDMIYEIIP